MRGLSVAYAIPRALLPAQGTDSLPSSWYCKYFNVPKL